MESKENTENSHLQFKINSINENDITDLREIIVEDNSKKNIAKDYLNNIKNTDIELTIQKPNTSNSKSIIESYYNPKNSYFNQYDSCRMGKTLKNLYENDKLENIINIKTKCIETKLLDYLSKQNIPSLDTEEGRNKLNIVINNRNLSCLQSKKDNVLKDESIALCVEKFYQNQKAKMVNKLIENDNSSQTSSLVPGELVNNYKNKKCPSYPPALQEPVFNPCEYPHLLKMYSHFYDHCYDCKNLHSLSGTYYSKLNRRLLFPILIISALSSILSFVASSSLISEYNKTILSIFVGSLTSLNAMIQSFSSAYQFDNKSDRHYRAADNYDQLITEIEFEKAYPNDADFFLNLENKILEVKSNCQYLIPNQIKSEYYNHKEIASDSEFINNKIVRPIRNELKDAIISGNFEEYKYMDQSQLIFNELEKLKSLKSKLTSNVDYISKKNKNKCLDIFNYNDMIKKTNSIN